MNLRTGGRPARLILNPKRKAPVCFSNETLDNFVTNLGISLRDMEKLRNFIRTKAGRKSVPSYCIRQASKKAKILKDVYQCRSFEFDIDELPEKETRPVVNADAETLLEAALEAREEYGEVRLILVCIVPNIKETYDNVEILWDLTQLNKIPFKFVSDFKLLLIIVGQETANSTYSCPFCFINLSDLRDGEPGAKTLYLGKDNVALQISEECLKLKTFGDLSESFKKFEDQNCDKKNAKHCHITVNLPLFDESDEMHIIEKAVIPELHEVQGIVNHIFFDGLVPLLGRDNAMKRPKKLNLISKHYHGEMFEGNACRRLLKEADLLNDSDILGEHSIFEINPFIQTLKTLDKLVNASFKSERPDDSWQQHVNELKRVYPATGLSNASKVHVLLEHLKHGLYNLSSDPLRM
ncbi:hypothetical protein Bhyg_11953 [Pseudolycoriella hygida]|uniref:Uncharacterized protein n=1 Tax=Pseudolycoriella hygida TaxID=35572 RepID=A0A9Q0S0E8_9DIPT|nr:hypothetical protein Bhyg_11953 [Pseudolycoriella hygida]